MRAKLKCTACSAARVLCVQSRVSHSVSRALNKKELPFFFFLGHGEQPPRESRIHEIHKLQPSTWTFQVPTERYIQTLRHTDTIMNTYTLTETQTGTSLVEVLK